MKPITKQLVIAALILTLVTVLSLGIRQARFSLHRTNTIESPVIAEAEPDYDPADSYTVDTELERQYADARDSDLDDEPYPEYVNASDSDTEAPSDDQSNANRFKGDYARSKGPKGLEKISLGDYQNVYVTADGQLWYVSERPDGKTVKMQVYIDEATGEMTVVDAKFGGSAGLEKVSLSDYDHLYITGEGEHWYVSEQPDGSVSKSQVQMDEATGEMIIISSEDYPKPYNGEERAAKD